MVVAVVGIGLIGGSFALALKKADPNVSIVGVDNNIQHIKLATEAEIIDISLPLDEAVKSANIVVLAIPVNAIKAILPSILDIVPAETVIFDMGSTKAGICEQINSHPNRKNFVAAHPIAGTENSGPLAAVPDLYDKKTAIICDKEFSNPKLMEKVVELHQRIGMHVIYMNSQDHDMHLAYVSHLSHITSFMLGKTVLEIEKNEKDIFNLAGSGFESTARLAKSSPEMWAPIFEQNSTHLITALDSYIKNLEEFKGWLTSKNTKAMRQDMEETNDIRRVLKGEE